MPILGIMASQISGKLWQPEGAYDSLATVTVGTAVSSITFAGIPSGYKHLQIRGITAGSVNSFADITFNSDTGSNYAFHDIYGDGASAGAEVSATRANIPVSALPIVTSVFNAFVADVLDYTSTNKNKTLRALSGRDTNGGGAMYLISGLWYVTPTAITSITITARSGNIAQYSSFALYGVK